MPLERLRVRHFRCFEETQLELDPELNWIVGQNASGKTSLLEALFFLGHGRSFRTTRPDRLIREGSAGFEIVAWLPDSGRSRVLGIGRSNGVTEARLAGEPLRGMAAAAMALPVVVLDSGMNQLISGGPGERRRWLDWGVFHVEHRFLQTWRKYRHALRQRNVALKAGAGEREIKPWTETVAQVGTLLAQQREAHFNTLHPVLMEYVSLALPGVSIQAQYRSGWAQDEALAESLERHLQKDRETGNTRQGPHRAEIYMTAEGVPALERLSRGQQKMLAGALWMAQLRTLTEHSREKPLLLVDDLAAELDGEHLHRFLDLLQRQPSQRVLTAIGDAEIAKTGLVGGKVFHVEHGALTHVDAHQAGFQR